MGLGFFQRLAAGAVFDGLAHFQEAGRQRPEAAARRNGAATQQHAAGLDHHGASDDLWIFIVDMSAGRTDQPLAVIAVRNLADEL